MKMENIDWRENNERYKENTTHNMLTRKDMV